VFPAGSTVPALTHVISLTTYEDRPIPGGGSQKVAVRVAEQRFSGFMVHALILCSMFAAPILDYVPKAVLYGVFLYMGLSSRQGNQLYDRCMLWLNFEPSTYPRLPYVTRTSTKRMHLFTLIQVILLGAVYGLTRVKQTGVFFPFFVAGLVPFRVFVLPLIFTSEELDVLDAHDDLQPDPVEDDATSHEVEAFSGSSCRTQCTTHPPSSDHVRTEASLEVIEADLEMERRLDAESLSPALALRGLAAPAEKRGDEANSPNKVYVAMPQTPGVVDEALAS
jgi:hypothetical protein